MLSLHDREWKEFKIKSLFTIEKCKCSNVSQIPAGNFPYIGATNRNNGVVGFVEKIDKYITKGNCIAFICDGDGSIGYSVYRFDDFIGSTTVKVGRSEFLNKYVGIFMTTVADRARVKYNFGYKRNELHLLNETLLLPISEHEKPDYAFMEQYIKEREQQIIQNYITYIGKNIQRAGAIIPLNEKEWKEFYINDIFIIRPGKRLTKSDMKSGSKPFIGASDSNNGVTAFIRNTNISEDRNVLGVNYNGSVVENFYHPYTCLFSDDVKRFEIKDRTGNEYLYLFLKTVILQQKGKYAYGYKFNEQRMRKQMIMLPIKDEGSSPDWSYMEQYAKHLFAKLKLQYLQTKLTA